MKPIRSLLLLALVLAALSAGCYRYVPEIAPENKLEIVDAEVVLGGKEAIKTVSYRIDVQNHGETDAQIEWVRPFLADNVRNLLAEGQDLTLKVGKGIPAGETLTLEGTFKLDTKGKKKADLNALQPYITRFTVVTRHSLMMPSVEETPAAE